MPIAVLLAAVLAQAPGAPAGAAEFPPYDTRVWHLQQHGMLQKAATRRLQTAPSDPETVRILMERQRPDDALAAARRIVESRPPEEMAAALRFLWTNGYLMRDGTRDYDGPAGEILFAARDRLRDFSREDAAVVALEIAAGENHLARAGSARWRERRAAVIREYAGTRAALEAEVADAAMLLPVDARLERLDAIAREHPGTEIAARALYEKASQLANTVPPPGPRNPDPAERFFQLLAIVEQLESGRYPKGEWVDRAPQLVIQFHAYQPRYGEGSVDRMIEGYRQFVLTHFSLDALSPLDNGIGYVISRKLGELFTLKGDPGAVEGFLAELERTVADRDAVRYLRALYVQRAASSAAAAEQPALIEKATGLLSALAAQGDTPYGRRALATLASLRMERGEYSHAKPLYARYVDRYPESAYAWVARLRVGEASEQLGDWAAARDAYARAAASDTSIAPAVVLGHELAARALEALNEPERALAEHRAALAAWDNDYGLEYSLYTRVRREPAAGMIVVIPRAAGDAPLIGKPGLGARIAQLAASLATPGGALLERGRWQMGHARRAAAVASFRELIDRHPRSPLVTEARLLMHQTQLEQALDLSNIERAGADPTAAEAILAELARAPVDVAVSIARIARATTRWTRGESAAAESEMTAAVRGWLDAQVPRDATTDLERDAAAIREVVFRPLGGGIYADARGWNAFTWPAALPPYLIVNPDLPVKTSDGEVTRISISRRLPGIPNVLFADTDRLALLAKTINALGGTKRREPAQIMETPNQPVGESMNILALWNKFFPARPGHWGGWEIDSYPQLTRIEFLDAARTRASAFVTVGYSGATVVLEKRDGAWTAVRLTNHWVT